MIVLAYFFQTILITKPSTDNYIHSLIQRYRQQYYQIGYNLLFTTNMKSDRIFTQGHCIAFSVTGRSKIPNLHIGTKTGQQRTKLCYQVKFLPKQYYTTKIDLKSTYNNLNRINIHIIKCPLYISTCHTTYINYHYAKILSITPSKTLQSGAGSTPSSPPSTPAYYNYSSSAPASGILIIMAFSILFNYDQLTNSQIFGFMSKFPDTGGGRGSKPDAANPPLISSTNLCQILETDEMNS
eukprot:TRINITY_DN8359_c0_g2_i13.p1 TRINITY_DN8359_c0_g2~~TRINITY_DN8359_c0_g2_i13.p1  ORF type:complete len:239 (+),score=-5.07 TRINITY_DN8359_c0_g2_i13:342-1058(+)